MEIKLNAQSATPEVVCVVCRTHARPWDVPWPQHTVGCAVRTGQLCGALAPDAPRVPRLAAA